MRASVLIAPLSLLAGLKWPTALRACPRPSFLPTALRTCPWPSFLPAALLWPTALVPARGPHMLLGRSKLPINFMTKLGQAFEPSQGLCADFCHGAKKGIHGEVLRAGAFRYHRHRLVERISRLVSMVGNDRMAIMLVDTAFLKAAFPRFCFRRHVLMIVRNAFVRNCTVEYLLNSRDANCES